MWIRKAKEKGGDMELVFKDGGTKAAKLSVASSNQICLNTLDELAGRFWSDGALTTSSRVNKNGGYLMFFLNSGVMLSKLDEIKLAVENSDSLAEITVFNYSPDHS